MKTEPQEGFKEGSNPEGPKGPGELQEEPRGLAEPRGHAELQEEHAELSEAEVEAGLQPELSLADQISYALFPPTRKKINKIKSRNEWISSIPDFAKEYFGLSNIEKPILNSISKDDYPLFKKQGKVTKSVYSYRLDNGKLHSTDGPAVFATSICGDVASEFWLNGQQYSKEEFIYITTGNSKSNIQLEFKESKFGNQDIFFKDRNGITHRDLGPAHIQVNRFKVWFKNGKIHREGAPAMEFENGDKIWIKNDRYHREDGPALELSGKDPIYYLNGKKLSEKEWEEKISNDKFTEDVYNIKIDKEGNKRWYNEDNLLHRKDGPAIEMVSGEKLWYLNGKLHREDGPAVEYANGDKYWYLNDKKFSEEDWKEKVSKINNFEIDSKGTKIWYNSEGLLHREDGPAIESANGTKEWYRNSKLHREDGPAAEYTDGTKFWYRNGELHREDGPAVEYSNGTKKWFRNGNHHREDGPAIEYASGTKHWYRNGKLHREDGPAVEGMDGTKKWFQNGKLHREDGPAVEYSNGIKHWWLNNEQLSEEDWKERVYKISNLEVAAQDSDGTKRWYNSEGKLHREDGPAVEYANGTKEWYRNGKLHREDGPALEWFDGDKFWMRNNVYHREDGPAVEFKSGDKVWYLNGNRLFEEKALNPKDKIEINKSIREQEKYNTIFNSVKRGIKLSITNEVFNLFYEVVTKQLKEKFNIEEKYFQNSINKEIITIATIALLNLASNLFEEEIEYSDQIRSGCSLLLEGKVKDNFSVIINNIIPLLSKVAIKMDPDLHLRDSLEYNSKIRIKPEQSDLNLNKNSDETELDDLYELEELTEDANQFI